MSPLAAFLIPVAVTIVFSLLARRFPAPKNVDLRERPKSSALFRTCFFVALFAGWLPTTGAAAWLMLQFASSIGPSQRADDLVLLRPPYLLWFVATMLPSLAILGYGLERLARRYWPAQYAALEASEAQRTGVDWKRIEKPILIGVVFLTVVGPFLLLNFWVRFEHDRLVVGRVWSFGSTIHSYSELDDVVLYRNARLRDGTLQRRPSLVLRFHDGFVWDSRWSPRDENERVLRTLAESLSRSAGKSMREEIAR